MSSPQDAAGWICQRRLKEFEDKEIWKRVLNKGYEEGKLGLLKVGIDSTTVEAKRPRSTQLLPLAASP